MRESFGVMHIKSMHSVNFSSLFYYCVGGEGENTAAESKWVFQTGYVTNGLWIRQPIRHPSSFRYFSYMLQLKRRPLGKKAYSYSIYRHDDTKDSYPCSYMRNSTQANVLFALFSTTPRQQRELKRIPASNWQSSGFNVSLFFYFQLDLCTRRPAEVFPPPPGKSCLFCYNKKLLLSLPLFLTNNLLLAVCFLKRKSILPETPYCSCSL